MNHIIQINSCSPRILVIPEALPFHLTADRWSLTIFLKRTLNDLYVGAWTLLRGPDGSLEKKIENVFSYLRCALPCGGRYPSTAMTALSRIISHVAEKRKRLRRVRFGVSAVVGVGSIVIDVPVLSC